MNKTKNMHNVLFFSVNFIRGPYYSKLFKFEYIHLSLYVEFVMPGLEI